MEQIKSIIWDLDNTLYPYEPHHVEFWHEATVRSAITLGAPVCMDQGMDIARRSYEMHNYSSKSFVEEFGLCQKQLHEGIFPHAREDMLPVCSKTQKAFEAHPSITHAILTHANKDWACRALNHLGLARFFNDDHILGLAEYDYQEKNMSSYGVERALEKLGTNAAQSLFVEDSLCNLEKAKKTGIQTAYVHQGSLQQGNDNKPPFVDYVFKNAEELLRFMAKNDQ
jgi:FMN phosphatase YigB (HAD superfamily)